MADGDGPVKVGEHPRPVEDVNVWFNGAASRLGIDPKSGEVLSIRYRGRGPGSYYQTIEKVFTDRGELEGVVVPVAYDTHVDGKPADTPHTTLSDVAVNAPKLRVRFHQR